MKRDAAVARAIRPSFLNFMRFLHARPPEEAAWTS
jgi:hypothetical protein